MFECEWFTFASCPKTGCHWFTETMTEAGVCIPHQGMHTIGFIDGKPSITIVREPAYWLRSYFYNVTGRLEMPVVDGLCELRARPRNEVQSFGAFAEKYIATMPGTIQRIFDHWSAEHTLRTEHLGADTCSLMKQLDVQCDLELIVNSEPRNVRSRNRPLISDDLRTAINEAA